MSCFDGVTISNKSQSSHASIKLDLSNVKSHIQCHLECQAERTVVPRTNSSRCNNTSCALVYIYTVLQQDHMAGAATAQQETKAVRIQLQYTLMQSEQSNHNHRYLSSPAHPELINKVNNTECARRESADGCDNTNDESPL